LVVRQLFTPPTITCSAFVCDTAMARSYHPCPPASLPSYPHPRRFGELDLRAQVAPLLVDRKKPEKPELPLFAASAYTYSGLAGETPRAILPIPPEIPVEELCQVAPPLVER
jgi:hypothetical protein